MNYYHPTSDPDYYDRDSVYWRTGDTGVEKEKYANYRFVDTNVQRQIYHNYDDYNWNDMKNGNEYVCVARRGNISRNLDLTPAIYYDPDEVYTKDGKITEEYINVTRKGIAKGHSEHYTNTAENDIIDTNRSSYTIKNRNGNVESMTHAGHKLHGGQMAKKTLRESFARSKNNGHLSSHVKEGMGNRNNTHNELRGTNKEEYSENKRVSASNAINVGMHYVSEDTKDAPNVNEYIDETQPGIVGTKGTGDGYTIVNHQLRDARKTGISKKYFGHGGNKSGNRNRSDIDSIQVRSERDRDLRGLEGRMSNGSRSMEFNYRDNSYSEFKKRLSLYRGYKAAEFNKVSTGIKDRMQSEYVAKGSTVSNSVADRTLAMPELFKN